MASSLHPAGIIAEQNIPVIGQQQRTGLRGVSHDRIDQERD